jgi:hypothetical protein
VRATTTFKFASAEWAMDDDIAAKGLAKSSTRNLAKL